MSSEASGSTMQGNSIPAPVFSSSATAAEPSAPGAAVTCSGDRCGARALSGRATHPRPTSQLRCRPATVASPKGGLATSPRARVKLLEILNTAGTEHLNKPPPVQVAPVVGCLLSEQCTDTASVYVVGGGNIGRIAQSQNPGMSFVEPPTIDELTKRWSAISDVTQKQPGTNPLG